MSAPAHSQTGLRTALGDIVGDPVLVSGTWYDCRALAHQPNVGTTVGLWRWRGRMRQGDGGMDWALVQKRLTLATRSPRWPGEPSEADWGYWRREADVLRATAFADLGPHLRRPRCHAIIDVGADVDVWTEDLGEPLSAAPTPAAIARAARRVGEWQGRYIGGDLDIPGDPFLCRDFIVRYRHLRNDMPPISRDWWDLPLARRHLDRSWEVMARSIEEVAPQLSEALAALPRVVNHNDCWPANLFEHGDDSILVDWAYAGVGASGEDIGNLIPDSVFDVLVPASRTDDLRRLCTDAYLEGIAAAGADVDPASVVLGINALAGLKYTWLLAHTLRSIAGDAMEASATRTGHSPDTLIAARAAGIDISLRMGMDAVTSIRERG